LEFVKDSVYREMARNVNKSHDRIVITADGVIIDMLANKLRGTEYRFDVCRATNGAHKELCEVQCLKMY
jgi:hypothetical protein